MNFIQAFAILRNKSWIALSSTKLPSAEGRKVLAKEETLLEVCAEKEIWTGKFIMRPELA